MASPLRSDSLTGAMETESTFPIDWPDGCPPDGATTASGPYVRIVRSNPPTAEDFVTHRESGKLRKAPECLRAGLSTFLTLADAERMTMLLPVLGDHLAVGQLGADYGRSMLTQGRQPTHTTLWPYVGVTRHSPFHVVRTVARGL